MTSTLKFSNNAALGLEPRLSDVLSDPLVHAVMARDGVTHDELRTVIRRAKRHLPNQDQR
jgi:hypothetical protein